MKWLGQLVALSLLLAAGTWFAGWWMVPIVSAVYGAWEARARLVVITATLAGAGGWGALLAYDAAAGPVGRLMDVSRALFHLPGSALVVLTLAYAALLGGSAAATARGVRRLVAPG